MPAAKIAAELTQAIGRSKKRVVLSAMVGLKDSATTPVLNAVSKALKRGVKVQFIFDAYTKTRFANNSLLFSGSARKQLANSLAYFDKLTKSGAEVIFINRSANPFMKRYHGKFFVADNTWFSFGGVNFGKIAFSPADYMLRGSSKKEADTLYDLCQQFAKQSLSSNGRRDFGDNQQILVDAGIPHKSLIYDTVCDLARRATQVIYVSPMAPTGPLAAALRSTNTTCYFNQVRKTPPQFRAGAALDRLRSKLVSHYSGKEPIHAKYMLFKLKNGRTATITGSHNFSQYGIALGTQEVALLSYDRMLYRQLLAYTNTEIAD